jgi:hypothetical protein
MPSTFPWLQGIAPRAVLLGTLPGLEPINLPDCTILIFLRHPVPEMHMELASMTIAMRAVILSVEFPGPALATCRQCNGAIKNPLKIVEVGVGQAKARAVDGVEMGEDEDV